VAAQVQAQVKSCLICGGQSGIGAGFLQVLRPSTDCSTFIIIIIIQAGTIGQLVANVPSELSLTPPQETNYTTEKVD
jgi:hypothetical protein